MTLSRSKTVARVVLLLSAGILGTCISLASTLPGPVSKPEGDTDAAPASLLPPMMDSSASFTDTGSTGAAPESHAAPAPLDARVDSSDGPGAQPDNKGCVPEPVSIILMTSGLLGLIAARRFRK
jgi:hypothetical protein